MKKQLTVELPFEVGSRVYFKNGNEVLHGKLLKYGYENYLYAVVSVYRKGKATICAQDLADTKEEALQKNNSEPIQAKYLYLF